MLLAFIKKLFSKKPTHRDRYHVPTQGTGKVTILAYNRQRQLIWTETHHNLIVDKASDLMAGLLNPNSNLKGITHLAVGSGVGNGTLVDPEAEISSQTALRDELYRKAVTSTLVNANKMTLSTTFDFDEAIGNITEMGLFGGNATVLPNSGYMFNFKVFSAKPKDSTIQLGFIWEITL